MLYLLGGASRAGKSTLARRLLERHGVPYFSLDVLMMGLANGWPAFGLDPNDGGVTRGELMWPIVRAMAVNLLEEEATHPAYLIEGDELLPKQAAELMRAYPGRVRACFIGYTHVDPAARLAAIRSGDPTWMEWAGEAAALAYMDEAMDFSRYLERECAALGLPYFDASRHYEGTIEAALACLVGRCPE